MIPTVDRPLSSVMRQSERNTSAEEKKFITDVQSFMNSRGTPIRKMPLLGHSQIDLFLFYTKVQMLGGYDSVCAGRFWKTIYNNISGNTRSTSASTITRRHYERLLLPYERYQRGEDMKMKLNNGRRTKITSTSEDSDIKKEPNDSSKTLSLIEAIPVTISPLQPIMSVATTLLSLNEKPRTEAGKTSSLCSVQVKPERLKSLNTIIANSAILSSQQVSQLPSPLPSSNTSISTPSSTLSTTPMNDTNASQNVLERQLNSPLICQQVPPSCSPSSLPVTVTTNASAVVTLTLPPEDMKEIKLDPKQTTLLAQGKENISLFGEKAIFAEKTIMMPLSRSPETENDTSSDKIIRFKKRKLGVIAVDLNARPGVIQSNIGQQPSPATMKSSEEKAPISYPLPITPNSIPKLISVTMISDIGHMLPSPHEHHNASHHQSRLPAAMSKQQSVHHNNNNSMMNNNMVNSRVIKLDSSNNRFIPLNVPNGRLPPPKVTQSRSIFVPNEETVYGNPKDIILRLKCRLSPQHPPSRLQQQQRLQYILDVPPLQVNGKYTVRNEPVSPYTPRKAAAEIGRKQKRRISESEKTPVAAQQQQQEPRYSEVGRRHNVLNIPSGFVPAVPQNNPTFLPQLPNTPGKFLPILDLMYYSAFYNAGLFSPVAALLPPEFSAYYKELLASSQPRLEMTGQHQPAVPTSK